jgi:peptidoglycan/LPS O-acetylase OafA/YrhL
VHLTAFERIIAYTPIHALWAGQEWVIVFFVLSGLVLSLAASQGQPFDAASYYPRRLVRLYIPVWAAVVLAAFAHVAVSHHAVRGATPWLNSHSVSLSPGRTAHDLTLIFGAGDGSLTTVLWSLKWEVLFSLLLPAYLLAAQKLNSILLTCASLLVILLGGSGYTHYMPVFMLGVVLAYSRPWITQHLTRTRALILLLVSFCLLSGDWWMPSERLGTTFVAVGAAAMVACGMVPGHFSGVLDSKPFQLVGSRSFSLYLVHEPLLVALAFALGGTPSLPLLLLVTIPLIALVTEAFYRVVERPAHRLARMFAARPLRAVS